MADRIVVLDGYTLNPGDLSWDGLEKFGELVVYDRTELDAVIERAEGARYVLTNKVPLSIETMTQLPDLEYVGVLATGYDVVAVDEAKRRGIIVTNVPTYGTDSVAQHVTSLMLELIRQPARHSSAVHEGLWVDAPDWCFALTPINELSGKTLSIIGMGRIGTAFARIGAAMGMSILTDVKHPPVPGTFDGLEVSLAPLDDLFQHADVLSLHCPLTPATRALVNGKRLRLMKTTAILLNTSRGPLVDNYALATALEMGSIAGAGIDVLDVEPPPADHPLLNAPNCIITPHIAWYARESRQRLMGIAVGNLQAFAEGHPVNCVV